jgi:hypothetical protein
MMDLVALPSYKRLVAWCPGPVEDMKRYFQQLLRLNRGLDIGHWRVYERRGEPSGVHHVLSIDFPPAVAMGKKG